jgi:hypothetical protein
MMNRKSNRGRIVAAGVAAALTAGLATGALAAGDAGPQKESPPRIAVLATVGTPAPDVVRALAAAREAAGGQAASATVVRAGGALEAQAQAAALAADGFGVVAGVGDAGRSAVGQAESAAVGDGTSWVSVR